MHTLFTAMNDLLHSRPIGQMRKYNICLDYFDFTPFFFSFPGTTSHTIVNYPVKLAYFPPKVKENGKNFFIGSLLCVYIIYNHSLSCHKRLEIKYVMEVGRAMRETNMKLEPFATLITLYCSSAVKNLPGNRRKPKKKPKNMLTFTPIWICSQSL